MGWTLTLRDVPGRVVRALRERARKNGRSLQEEMLAILEGVTLDRESLGRQLSAIRSRARARPEANPGRHRRGSAVS